MSPGMSIQNIGKSLAQILKRMGTPYSGLIQTVQTSLDFAKHLQIEHPTIGLIKIKAHLSQLLDVLSKYGPNDSKATKHGDNKLKIAIARTLVQALQSKVEENMKFKGNRQGRTATPDMYGTDSDGSGTWADDEALSLRAKRTGSYDSDTDGFDESDLEDQFGPYMFAPFAESTPKPVVTSPLPHIALLNELESFLRNPRNPPPLCSEAIDKKIQMDKRLTVQDEIKSLTLRLPTSEQIDDQICLDARLANLLQDLNNHKNLLPDIIKQRKASPSSEEIDEKLGLNTLPAYAKTELNPIAAHKANAAMLAAAIKASVPIDGSRADSESIDQSALSHHKQLMSSLTVEQDPDRTAVAAAVQQRSAERAADRAAAKAAQLAELHQAKARLLRTK